MVLDADNNPSQVLRDEFLDTTGEPEDDNVKFTKRFMVWVSSAS